MGTTKRLDCQDNQVTLYTSQTDEAINHLMEHGVYYVRLEFVAKKYAEVADVFLQAYSWYAQNACKIVERPNQAESAVWALAAISGFVRVSCRTAPSATIRSSLGAEASASKART